jgi:hypothetical protein
MAKGLWYESRLGWTETAQAAVEEGLADLEKVRTRQLEPAHFEY